MPNVLLIGAGNMGSALIGGWLESGVLAPSEIAVSERDEARGAEVAGRYGIALQDDVASAAAGSGFVVLAIKPQDCMEVLRLLAPSVGSGHAVISIIAGLSLATMRREIGDGPSLVRVMPNIAAKVRAAVSAFSVEAGEGGLDVRGVLELLGAVGETVEVEERWLDLVTALSGSGPAYYYMLTEALEEAGVECGMERAVAKKLARGTFRGAAALLDQSGEDAALLRKAVSSPGGTTMAGIGELEKAGFAEAVGAAVAAARNRARELTN